jgi:HSP20 family molecular chaperone IbpA
VSHPKRNDPFAELYGEFSDRLRGDRWQPDVDVFETEKEIVVRVDLAGVRSGDLRVTVDGSMLRISGVRVTGDSSEVKRLHQMEIASGPFERRVRVPVAFDREPDRRLPHSVPLEAVAGAARGEGGVGVMSLSVCERAKHE